MSNLTNKLNLYYLLVILVLKGLAALRMVRLDVPGIVTKGNDVWLSCQYDIETEKLYSVKWYHNRTEFYRYQPSDTPPGQTYDIPGVNVDLEQSNGSHVLLHKADFATEGSYRCEISAESPSFQTITAEKELHVYHLPNGGPQITGLESQYEVGDYLNLTCATEPSKPPAKLEWLLNRRKVPKAYQRHREERLTGDFMTRSEVTLVKMLQATHFPNGVVTITCVATLEQLDSSVSKELIIPDTSQWAPSFQVSEAVPGQTPPEISGGPKQYDTGDHVTVNCSSANSTPVKLKWLINEKPVNDSQLVHYDEISNDNGTTANTLGLHFRLLPHHFKNQEVRLRCESTTFRLVHLSNEAEVQGGPQSQLHTEMQFSEKNSMEVKSINVAGVAGPNSAVARQPFPVLVTVTFLTTLILFVIHKGR